MYSFNAISSFWNKFKINLKGNWTLSCKSMTQAYEECFNKISTFYFSNTSWNSFYQSKIFNLVAILTQVKAAKVEYRIIGWCRGWCFGMVHKYWSKRPWNNQLPYFIAWLIASFYISRLGIEKKSPSHCFDIPNRKNT